MEEKNISEFNNNGCENNFDSVCEQNKIAYTNGSSVNTAISEKNDNSFVVVSDSEKKRKNQRALIKLLSGFVFLLAAVATVQTSIYVPLFSDIFSPIQQTQVANEVIISPTYEFSGLSVTDKKISLYLSADNINSENGSNYLYVVNQLEATDEFINSIDESVKAIGRFEVLSGKNQYSFTKYLSATGWVNLQPETKYSIIVVNDNKIVTKENVITIGNPYISSVNVKVNTDTIRITDLSMVSEFHDYSTILIQIVNLTDSTWGPEGNGIDETTTDRAHIEANEAGPFEFNVTKMSYEQEFVLKIYCMTDHPENIEYESTYYKNGTLLFYLIYTQSGIIL